MDKATQSKERISEALIRLLKVHPYAGITIQMIAEEADVSRMAFYRNFENRDEVIRYYIVKQTDQFERASRKVFASGFSEAYFRMLVQYLSDAREIGLLLIHTDLFDIMRKEFDRIYIAKAKNDQERPWYYFIAGGICNVYYYWLVNGCRESPEDLTAALVRVLDYIRIQENRIGEEETRGVMLTGLHAAGPAK